MKLDILYNDFEEEGLARVAQVLRSLRNLQYLTLEMDAVQQKDKDRDHSRIRDASKIMDHS